MLRTRQIAWHHPEWWLLLLAGGGWAYLITEGPSFNISAICFSRSPGSLNTLFTWSTETWIALWSPAIEHSVGMLTAMMLPLTVPQARYIAFRSQWSRRNLAIFELLAGYCVLWLLFCLALVVLSLQLAVITPIPGRYWRGAALGLAALWQLSPAKRRALVQCDRTHPIAPAGFRAHIDCIRNGVLAGWSCMKSCWALMLALAVSGHTIALTAIIAIALYGERSHVMDLRRVSAVLFAALAAATFAWG